MMGDMAGSPAPEGEPEALRRIVERLVAVLEERLPGWRDIRGRLVIGAGEEVHPFLAAVVFEACSGPLLVVVPGREAAAEMEDLLAQLLGGEAVRPFPFRELVIAGERGEDAEAVSLRSRALAALCGGKHVAVVCEAEALGRPFPIGREALEPLRIRVGMEVERDEVLLRLADMGYQREYLVEGAGQFAVRGAILDVYDPALPLPVRAEFFGDRVERVRYFNPVDQRSGEALEEAAVYPVRSPHTEECSLLALPGEGGAVVFSQPLLIRERLRSQGAGELILHECVGEKGSRDTEERDFRKGEGAFPRLVELDPVAGAAHAFLPVTGVAQYRGRMDALASDLRELLAQGWEAWMFLETEGRRARIREFLEEEGIPVSSARAAGRGRLALSRDRCGRGFRLPGARLIVIGERDVFGGPRARPAMRVPPSGRPVEGWWDLEEGDYVVHVNHGIAVYGGLVEREVEGSVREYLLLRYAGGDSLYVPSDRIDLVHRYVGAEKPTVHRLSGRHWQRVKRRARAAAREMAVDLLRLYAERMARPGHAFSPDDPWQRELEESFPFVETPDQAKAVREVKEDMERPVPMDRLVYGDVGYGKTEVAVRAAFKAVMDGRQVAVLVPTTVLAQQHHRTFSERFSPFPVRVEVLSRFRSPREQRELLEKIASGEVDVVIGTHRLLQEDVHMANLGLVIVDEEHRFGVAQKERLKALRRSVDVLTLTATPIPRTLQMSLSGLRDMSVIDTPIEDRQAVITSVGPYDERLVREAIRNELSREGQVFYVHNRVQTIERAARHVRELVPEARVLVGHGQMREERLQRVMEDFISHRADVLVCTTIVESGLDIPNANTLIVDGAENLGLAQLYHLRGRIGRSDRQAYAYFLFRPGGRMTEGAAQRLKVVRDFSELGAGLRVAMKDLEIRGAGNLLGPEQHGHVEAVGFELYCRMLAEAVEELRGRRRPRASQVTIDLPLRAFVPEEYVARSSRRVEIYRRLAEAREEAEISSLYEEVRDRYGPPPPESDTLFAVARLRLACMAAGVREVGREGDMVVLRLGAGGARRVEELLAGMERAASPWSLHVHRRGVQELVLRCEEAGWKEMGIHHVESLARTLIAAAAGEAPVGDV
ncbi:MAG: transcription-repair coupling factor [Actinobacteria bacterium]|nr:transcription-repair coupling factor [Actinomycetota bacterium]